MDHLIRKYALTDSALIGEIEKALLDTYFSDYDPTFLNSKEGREDIRNNVYKRYNHSLEHVVPWIGRYTELAGKNVLEIGCGTGSSTAALSHFVGHIEGYDIHDLSVQGASRRMEIMELDNVSLHVVDSERLFQHINEDGDTSFDLILLFAVLEHQTIEERIFTLRRCWELLADEGIMVIVDTPNLLCYYDAHTSRMPFLHMLPSRLYALYSSHSHREGFNTAFAHSENMSAEELDIDIARWARGVSYHDFEMALGKGYKKHIVSHGFDKEILDWYTVSTEEILLRWYVEHKQLDVPLGLTRWVLNLILQKGGTEKRYNSTGVDSIERHIFLPEKQLNDLESQLLEKDRRIAEVYLSKTYRMGDLLATPYRKLSRMLSWLFTIGILSG